MQADPSTDKFFQSKVLGHPAGLFVLFFTEMWERFSFYGMRVLMVLFLTWAIIGSNPGWEWPSEHAGALFGTYAGLLYLTPILGGFVADKILGYRGAVVLGAMIMMLGHFCMALETEATFLIGLALLVVGTGLFKPSITSIISHMYKDLPKKKDGAYTIFYMGVNAGAFFGMMLCGYLGEKVGWKYGFGLAGIFMLFGAFQFWLARPLFGSIGSAPEKKSAESETAVKTSSQVLDDPGVQNNPVQEEKRNPFTLFDKILTAIASAVGFIFLINDPASKIYNIKMLPAKIKLGSTEMDGPWTILLLFGLVPFLILVISRIIRYTPVVRGRMIAFVIFAFITVFFWMSFEQGATSLVIFAKDYTNRFLYGNDALIFNIVNLLLTIGPLIIVTWVLFRLFAETWREIKASNIVLGLSFVGVWIIGIWMINRDLNTEAIEFTYQTYERPVLGEDGLPVTDEKTGQIQTEFVPVTEATLLTAETVTRQDTATFSSLEDVKKGTQVNLHKEGDAFVHLNEVQEADIRQQIDLYKAESAIFSGTVIGPKSGMVEVTASWFSILNSFFIISLASFFSKWWESKYNPSPAMKYGLGLIIMAAGFGILAFGSYGLEAGSEIKLSMMWLVFAYLFHTMGELCVSPVGLSMVSKLVPGRMIAFMFGMWYLAIAIGNKSAASLGGMIDEVVKDYSLSVFFLIFTIVPVVAGILIIVLNPVMKKLMKGVE